MHSWRPPPPAHSWDVGRAGGRSPEPAGSHGALPVLLRPSVARPGPWPCAPRAPRVAASWRSCSAAAGGRWPRSPRSPAPAVRAAACASAPPCAACICCWRPCPPWRRRPPSCECGGGAGPGLGGPGPGTRGCRRGCGSGGRAVALGPLSALAPGAEGGPERGARGLRSFLC